jgi:hypothetical protein
VQYRQQLDQREQQRRVGVQRTAQLQQQHRTAQYAVQVGYDDRMRQQRVEFERESNRNYADDAYFYTAPSVRYYRGGSYYETNRYGEDLLRRSVNYGYEEGYRTGTADREDRWRSNYRDSYPYEDASYGYTGYYVDQGEYSYYFREGFRRGYEDGFARSYRYGHYESGKYTMLGAMLGQILDFQSLR